MVCHFSMVLRVISLLLVSSMVSSSLSPAFAGIDDDNPEAPTAVTASPVAASSYYDLVERVKVLSQRLNHWQSELAQAKAARGLKRNRIRRINHAANMVEGARDDLKSVIAQQSIQRARIGYLGSKVFSQSTITNLIFGEQDGYERMNLTPYEREQAKLVSKSWYHAVKIAEKDSVRFRLEPTCLVITFNGENLAQRYAHLVIEGYGLKTYARGSVEVPAYLDDRDTIRITLSPCLKSVDLRVIDFGAVGILLFSMKSSTELHVEMDQPLGERTGVRRNDASFSGFMTWMRCVTSMISQSSQSTEPLPVAAPIYDPKGDESWSDYKVRLKTWEVGRMGEILTPQSRAENSSECHPPKPRRGLRDLVSLALSFQSAVDAVEFLNELYLQLDLVNKWRAPPSLQKIVMFINQYVKDFSSDLDHSGLLAHREAEVTTNVLGQLTALQAKFGPRLQIFTKNDVFDGVRGDLSGDTLPSYSVAGILPVVMSILKQCRGVGFRIEFLKVLSCVRPSTIDAVLSLIRKSVLLGPSFQDSLEGTYVHPNTVSAVAELTPSYRSSALEGIDVVFKNISPPMSQRYQWIEKIRHCILFFGLIPPPDHHRVAPHLMSLFYYDGGFSQKGSKKIEDAIRTIPSDDRADVICYAAPDFFGNTSVDDKLALLMAFHRIPKGERADIRESALKYDVMDSERLFIIKTLATLPREMRDQIDAFVARDATEDRYKGPSHMDCLIAACSGIPSKEWNTYARRLRDHRLGFCHLYANCNVNSPKGFQLLCRLLYDQDVELKRIKDSLPPLRYAYIYTCMSEWTDDLEKLFKEYNAVVLEQSKQEETMEGLLMVTPSKRFPVLKRLLQIYKVEERIAKEKRDSGELTHGDVQWNGMVARTGIKTHLVPLMKVLEDYSDEEFELAQPLVQGYVDELELRNYYSKHYTAFAQPENPQYAPIFAGLRKVNQADWKELFKVLGRVIDGDRVPAHLSKRDFFLESVNPSSDHFWKKLRENLRLKDEQTAEVQREQSLRNRPTGSRLAVWF